MAGEFDEAADAAGWVRGDDGRYQGPFGARAWAVSDDPAFPASRVLCVSALSGERRYTFAVGVGSMRLDSSEDNLTPRVLGGPAAVAAGAVVPWFERLRGASPVWAREDDGPWWPLGGGIGREKIAGLDASAQPLVTGFLAALTRDPAAEAVRRAERTRETLAGAGWRVARAGKDKPGFRCLAAANLRGRDGAKHRVEYVLTGDPGLPECLLWRHELPADGDASAERETLLIDVTGALDPDLPLDLPADRLDAVLALVVREAPGMRAATSHEPLLALVTLAPTLYVSWRFTSYNLGFTDTFAPGFPDASAPAWTDAEAAVRAEPSSGTAWLALALAASRERRRHVAVEALGKAHELGTGDGLPLLWRGWLRRALEPDAAVGDLERAVAAGGVVGPARALQAEVLELWLGDREAAFAAYRRATEDDPGFAAGWRVRGLRLAACGRTAEALRVLTEAAARHDDARIRHALAYACVLDGDHDGALDALEEAVRTDPGLLAEITADGDLAPLRGHPRLDGLAAVAASADTARHERARNAVRATAPPPRARERATGLADVLDALKIFRRRVDGYRKVHAAGITHQETRAFLADVGLPREAGDFRLDGYFDGIGGAALREYRTDDPHGRLYGAEHVRDGLAGLFVLGGVGGGAEAAVEGNTGEVFAVDEDFGLTWLAPSLEDFLLPRCLPDGAWVRRVTPDTVDLLDGSTLTGIEPGRLALVVTALDEDGNHRLRQFLTDHGELVHHLRVGETRYVGSGLDLSTVDFAARCPNLRELHVHRGTVNESVFAHPVLERLRLTEAESTSATPELRVTGSRLVSVELRDTSVRADRMIVGPGSPLARLEASLDEDFGSAFPQHLEFDGCPDLGVVRLNLDGCVWTLTLRGPLPRLYEVSQDAHPYGRFTYDIVTADADEKKRLRTLIKKGARYARRH
ncbi:hypothetical protein LO772_10595 [Yinghuangia sp. ASG 101]|uniref:hypothetical protein n=1 Tax=Yinghuangia sp. ASG 101 TaxID=2896848 RepID=UPI001E49A8A4|nr:hypothetical protein [Yinghuangia sp. ASG 101]UGQ14003.1 hypothetical protein LO772_10595 [Yinghuangia sp. ASG 101]